MKPFVDLFPILLFFGAYKLYDIYTATAVLMAATVLQTAYVYQTQKRLEIMHKVTLVLVPPRSELYRSRVEYMEIIDILKDEDMVGYVKLNS